MAVVNRFSREPQVAKFDPLTAEEIMKVPIGKQVMEDEQRAAADAQLAALYNTKSLEGDRERIEKRKNELEQKLMGITNEIATNGIGRNTTDALNNLKREYDKELSASGSIGQANAFVGLQEQARKEFLANPKNLEMGSDFALRYWDESVRGRSAFNEDGTYKSEFAGVALPDYVVAGDDFRSRAKAAGTSTISENGTIINKNNEQSLAAIHQDILNKYRDENSKEYRSMIAQGKDINDIENELTLAYNEALQTQLGSYTPKGGASGTGGKKTAAQIYAEARAGEHFFQRAGTGLKPTDIKVPSVNEMVTEEHDARADIWAATSPEEKAIAEDRYKEIRNKNAAFKRSFDNTQSGMQLKAEVDKAAAELPEELVHHLEEGLVGFTPTEKGYSIKYFVPEGEVGTEEDRIKLANNLDLDKIKAYQEAKSRYDSKFNTMLKDGESPDIIVPDFVMNPYDNKSSEEWERWQKNERNTMKSSSGLYNFESITGFRVDSDEAVDGSGKNRNASYTQGIEGVDNNVLMTQLLKDENSIKKFEISALNQQSDIRNMGGLMSITLGDRDQLPDEYKDYAGRTIQVRYTLTDDAVKRQVAGSEAVRAQYTSNLNRFGNKDISNFAMHNQDRMAYDNIAYPSVTKNYDYFNDDNIKDHFSKAKDSKGNMKSKGAKLLLEADDKKVDIYATKDGKYRMGIATGKGKQLPLTTGQLAQLVIDNIAANGGATPEDTMALRYLNKEVNAILTEMGVPGKQPGERTEDYTKRITKARGEAVETLTRIGTDPIELDNHYDFYKILE